MAAHRWRARTPALGQVIVATLVAAMLVALASSPTSRAAFADTSGNTGNSAAAAACFYAPTVQSGTATNSADGTQTITISTVDPAKAFLIFNTRHDSNRPVGSVLGGRIASATSVEFSRNTDESTPVDIDIQWYVVEYSCGVSVQRGTAVPSVTPVDVAITPVAAMAQAFVTYSKTVEDVDNTWDGNDGAVVDLTSTSNLQIRTYAPYAGHTIYWQLVEFTDPTTISVQRAATSIPIGSTTASVTLPSSVDTTKSFAIVSSNASPQDTDEVLLRTRLLSSTNLEIARSFGTNNSIDEVSWQVVEMLDGTSVQHFHTLLNPGIASSNVAISSVDLGRAVAFAGTQNGGGQNGGRTTYFSDDIIGVASATFSFNSSTQVSVARSNTADSSSFGWHVVEWGN